VNTIGAADPARYPEALRAVPRWITWKHLSGKKPPVDEGGHPVSDWTKAWMTFGEAAERFASPSVDGLGFVLGDGWGGLDLDDCRDPESGELHPLAQLLTEEIGAYWEVSPSGKGIKFFGRASCWLELTFKEDGIVLERKEQRSYFAVVGGGTGDPTYDLTETIAQLEEQHAPAKTDTTRTKSRAAAPVDGQVLVGQDHWLAARAGAYRRQGMDEGQIRDRIWSDIQLYCPATGDEPWSMSDAERHARSAMKYEPAEDRFPLTDQGSAEFFHSLFGDEVRYDFRRGRWLLYNGIRWQPDQTMQVRTIMVESQRGRTLAALKQDDKDRVKRCINGENVDKVKKALEAAQAMPSLATVGDEWDRNPMLLGVENGVVDLQTGELRDGSSKDLITMSTAVSFDPEAKCPLWEATLEDIFKDHPELVPYMQKALGYSLTGDCSEEIFFLATGGGRNGKGTIINTVGAILGDYAETLNFNALEGNKYEASGGSASPDIAKLSTARFVMASETSGGRFNEAKIKALTGRDPISARFLHRDEFTFIPQFKMWLSVNELPKVRDGSDGFWARPHRVPFLQCYKGREDQTLKDRLWEEREGILAWLVRGCTTWQKDRLGRPKVIDDAVKEYQNATGQLADFFEDCCVFHEHAEEKGGKLWGAYQNWAGENQIRFPLRKHAFFKELDKKAERKKIHGERAFRGLGLRAPESRSGDVPF
jgi:putative DNA primase/helicase